MLTQEMKDYVETTHEMAKAFVRDMCKIPAPSGMEDQRAQYVKAWFEANGGENVIIDEAKNVICPYGIKNEADPLVVVMAHLDTVFPDLEPMPFSEHDGKYFCPGVTDDTANLASLVIAARYIMTHKIPMKYGILFVANSCEEGLGNLKGSRQIVKDYGKRIRHFITVDGTAHENVVTHGVGSHRYQVVVRTEGGHSYAKFGNRNAIASLSKMICDLYSVEVPHEGDSKTTFNVGTIEGGTSVNTIAQEACMLYEYRSDNVNCLAKMESLFHEIVEAHRATGLEVDVQRIGERPVGYEPETDAAKELLENICTCIRSVIGKEPKLTSGSTDANIPLSVGIPAICITGAEGGGCHTREEWLDVKSLKSGVSLVLALLSGYSA